MVVAQQTGYVRVWAFDNHFLTLTDQVAGDWPYVLVTYPKAAKFLVEEEPLVALKNAKQIRAAIISDSPIGLPCTQPTAAMQKTNNQRDGNKQRKRWLLWTASSCATR